jgi:hypothetical protein
MNGECIRLREKYIDKCTPHAAVARNEIVYTLDIAPDESGQQQGHIYRHQWRDFDDGRRWESEIMRGDWFGRTDIWIYGDNNELDEHLITNGDAVETVVNFRQRSTGPAPTNSIIGAFFEGLAYGAVELGLPEVILVWQA